MDEIQLDFECRASTFKIKNKIVIDIMAVISIYLQGVYMLYLDKIECT